MSAEPENTPEGLDAAGRIARGVARYLAERDVNCLAEFTLKTGRRVDLIALDRKGVVTIVEVKSSVADYKSDGKWQEYLPFCDRFYFAVAADFPADLLPADCGIMIADAFGASVERDAPQGTLKASRRKALTLRFARTAATRLRRFNDPDWIRG